MPTMSIMSTTSIMTFATRSTPGIFGPFDGDFDPFEDDEGACVLIPLE
ncbi:MAG: hypothetical protein NTY25_02730 [Planctomycetia bacterium]|nr:hypothetical protein [Planctomycetia bacterium]